MLFKKILKTRSVWLCIGSKKWFSLRFLKKEGSREFLFLKMSTIWDFSTDLGPIHASGVSRMRSCISIREILKLNPAKFSLK